MNISNCFFFIKPGNKFIKEGPRRFILDKGMHNAASRVRHNKDIYYPFRFHKHTTLSSGIGDYYSVMWFVVESSKSDFFACFAYPREGQVLAIIF